MSNVESATDQILSIHEIKQALNPVADVVVCADHSQGEEVCRLILGNNLVQGEARETRREILGEYHFSSGFPFNHHGQVSFPVFKEYLDRGRDTYNLWRIVILHALTRYDDSLLSGKFLLENPEAFARDVENAMQQHKGKRIFLFDVLTTTQDTWLPGMGEKARVNFLQGLLRAVLWLRSYRHFGVSGKVVILDQQLASLEPFGAKLTAFVDSSKLFANAAWLTGAESKYWVGSLQQHVREQKDRKNQSSRPRY